MDRREELHEILCELLGSRNVYYQPPENIKMKYPCIRYEREPLQQIHADNDTYLINVAYNVIVIEYEPDAEIVFKLAKFPKCKHNRPYVADGLYHDAFTLYY